MAGFWVGNAKKNLLKRTKNKLSEKPKERFIVCYLVSLMITGSKESVFCTYSLGFQIWHSLSRYK